MSNSRPLFAFAFRSGSGHAVSDFAEVDAAAVNADFVWVHLDLSDAVAQAWLRRRSWPPDVVAMVSAPVQRGRLFIAPDMVYGHLRDFRDEPGAITLQAGSLCVVALPDTARHRSTYPAPLHRGVAKPGRRPY